MGRGATQLTIEPLTADRWEDVVALFGARGDPSWCWCQYFLTTGRDHDQSAAVNKAALHQQVTTGARPPGCSRMRGGVGTALLEAAVDFARAQGARMLEGHPVDVAARASGKASGAELYHGVASTFARAGFEEVGRTGPSRPVMRLTL